MKGIFLFSLFITVLVTAEARDYNPDDFDKITIITYSHDGKYIAIAELEGLIKIYDSGTLSIIWEFEGPFAAQAMEFSPDNLWEPLKTVNYIPNSIKFSVLMFLC
jgi:WD40 repeat protein